jgi:hypothetical protein
METGRCLMICTNSSSHETNGKKMLGNVLKAIMASTLVGVGSSMVLASAVLLLNV